jgi:FKBP-type peptidyl-prolyl cis-trans isomerase
MKSIQLIIWLGMAMALAACGNSGTDDNATVEQAMPEAPAIEAVEIVPGLSMRMLQEGTGAVAEVGHTAVVHYTGWLFDPSEENNRGNKFDSSVDRGQHFSFPLGGRRVIRGWDEGVVGMKIGEVRELTIAPEMAYGDRQVGDLIPPGSTLVFEVELADLQGLDTEPATTP